MLDRTAERFGLKPDHLAADSAYGSAANLAWLVRERQIAPHIPVFDKSARTDGTFSRSDFTFDAERNLYTCPEGKTLMQFRRSFAVPRSGVTKAGTRLYRGSRSDCGGCRLKPRCCPNTPVRNIPRDVDEDARDGARGLAATPAFEASRHRRKKVEMLFAHLKRILKLNRLRLRGPNGARDEFLLAATAQNLRKLAKLRPPPAPALGAASQGRAQAPLSAATGGAKPSPSRPDGASEPIYPAARRLNQRNPPGPDRPIVRAAVRYPAYRASYVRWHAAARSHPHSSHGTGRRTPVHRRVAVSSR